jgi:hypothetical protein
MLYVQSMVLRHIKIMRIRNTNNNRGPQMVLHKNISIFYIFKKGEGEDYTVCLFFQAVSALQEISTSMVSTRV